MLWGSLLPASVRGALVRPLWGASAACMGSVLHMSVRHRNAGHSVRKRLKQREERLIDNQVNRVKEMLRTVVHHHHFKQSAFRARMNKYEVRLASRAIVTNPVALDRAYRIWTSCGGDLYDPLLVGELFELLKLYRLPQYEELDVDLSQPHQWFPFARQLQRTLHLHIGPTNSGKTHTALEALSDAESGWYAGPLRLLAWEVHDRLSKNKHNHSRGPVPCNLVTGQEIETHPDARHTSSTVEMVDVTGHVDVGVVDEIQMIGDPHRGWAWSRAVLGLPARELHLCGDPSATDLVRRMCELTGDALHVHEYKRLSPLVPINKAFRDLSALQPGDCVVAFSKKQLYLMKKRIEARTSHTCSLVYGALPPETRRSQAELFNTGANAVLVATDAVGMGLNLQIGRVIMSSLSKFDGDNMRSLHPAETKQIVGRAGRYGSQFPEGKAAVMHRDEVQLLQEHMAQPVVALERAGLMPPFEIVQLVARQQPDLSLYDLFSRFESVRSQDRSLYFMCTLDTMKDIARMLHAVPQDALPLQDRWVFCMAPVKSDDRDCMLSLKDYALGYTYDRVCRLPRWQANIVLEATVPATPQELSVLENVYVLLDLYVWLGNRLGDDIFLDMKEVFQLREACCDLIEQGLEAITAKQAEEDREPCEKRNRRESGLSRFERRSRLAGDDKRPGLDAVAEATRDLESVIVKLEALRLKNKAAQARTDAGEASPDDFHSEHPSQSFF